MFSWGDGRINNAGMRNIIYNVNELMKKILLFLEEQNVQTRQQIDDDVLDTEKIENNNIFFRK